MPFSLVHHSFEHHARVQPHVVAVEHNSFNDSITYSQLDLRANRLAKRLREGPGGIRPGKRVCIVARRSIPLVVAILAVLKAGGQYVPLDAVTITDETLDFVLQDASPSVVLVMNEYAERIRSCEGTVVRLEDAIRVDENVDVGKIDEAGLTERDGCYCIYTSGTTGRPKGVDVRHHGVSNVICSPPGNVNMAPSSRVAQLLNIAFDMGAWEILGSLYNGCTLCLRGNSKKDWIALLKTVHVVIATPSILAQHDPEEYETIRDVIVGGEPCPQALADRWAQSRGKRFHNCCGPTEISICNTVQPHTPGVPLSIGKPIPNTNVYILSADENDRERPVPIGHIGEMWVGGIGVSQGYLNLPDKTAERWRPDPFVGIEGARMFNTGDLGRWRADGQLEHLGRADDQVKIKGFRVELDGVSSSLRRYGPVHGACTLLIDNQLWGFVTPRLDLAQLGELREEVKKSQPYYAVPSCFCAMEKFEMTSNGKVDKKFLRRLVQGGKEGLVVLDSSTPPAPKAEETLQVTTIRWTPPLTPAEPSGSMETLQFNVPILPTPFSLSPPSSKT